MHRMRRIRLSRGEGAGMLASMRFLLLIWRSWAAARTRSELRALSDRTLRDIGLERGEIDSLFR